MNKHLVNILILIVVGFLCPIIVGMNRPFFEVSDCDVVYSLSGLFYHSGERQFYMQHTGLVLIIILGTWIKVASFLNPLGCYSMVCLEKATNLSSVMQPLVELLRYNSILQVIGFGIFVYFLTWKLLRHRGLSISIAIFFLLHTSVLVHSIIIRAEFICAFLGFISLVAYVNRKYVLFGMFSILSALTKVQIIPLLLILPLWNIFTRDEKNASSENNKLNSKLIIILSVVPIFLFFKNITVMLAQYWDFTNTILAVYFLLVFAIVCYQRKSITKPAISVYYIIAGLSFGFLVNYLYFNVGNVFALSNFFEHSKRFCLACDTSSFSIKNLTITYLNAHEYTMKIFGYFGVLELAAVLLAIRRTKLGTIYCIVVMVSLIAEFCDLHHSYYVYSLYAFRVILLLFGVWELSKKNYYRKMIIGGIIAVNIFVLYTCFRYYTDFYYIFVFPIILFIFILILREYLRSNMKYAYLFICLILGLSGLNFYNFIEKYRGDKLIGFGVHQSFPTYCAMMPFIHPYSHRIVTPRMEQSKKSCETLMTDDWNEFGSMFRGVK